MVAMGFLSRRFESLGLCARTEATATTTAVLRVPNTDAHAVHEVYANAAARAQRRRRGQLRLLM
jgi:hypothetical protein